MGVGIEANGQGGGIKPPGKAEKMARFEVGKEYHNDGFSIEVIKRTAKTITVTNGFTTWRMLIRTDGSDEYVIDSKAPKKWRDALTYRA